VAGETAWIQRLDPVLRPMPVYLPETQCTCSGKRTMNGAWERRGSAPALAVLLTAGVAQRRLQADV